MSVRGFLSSRYQWFLPLWGALRVWRSQETWCVSLCVLWMSTSQWACSVCAHQLVHVYVWKHLPASFSVLVCDTQLSVGFWVHACPSLCTCVFLCLCGSGDNPVCTPLLRWSPHRCMGLWAHTAGREPFLSSSVATKDVPGLASVFLRPAPSPTPKLWKGLLN